MKKNIDHYLLRPLDRRRTLMANQRAVVSALERLDDRTLGNAVLPAIAKSAKALRRNGSQRSLKDPAYIREQVVLSEALYLSRRVSLSEYVYFATSPVEMINDERWIDGQFNDELHEIRTELDAIDKESGLLPDQYWRKGQAPEGFRDRYNALQRRYSVSFRQGCVTRFSLPC